ncbi:MAG: methyltransferase domain-containing protein [Saprospiraceae bacterium]|nr:methyltransferase domain-containing protein [Saprospiraceae bacterium]
MTEETNAYILGTEAEELHRLGYQHEIWSMEASRAWKIAGISHGSQVLDLGAGPGYCSIELAYLVGKTGGVTAVDKSPVFIEFLNRQSELHHLGINGVIGDIREADFGVDRYDHIWGRWVLAWVDQVDKIVERLALALKPGGRMIFQEYYDWSTFQTYPDFKEVLETKHAILKSFAQSGGQINIGRELPELFCKYGLKIQNIRSISKLTSPDTATWHWIKSFFELYGSKVVNAGLLHSSGHRKAMDAFEEMESIEGASLLPPLVVEVIAYKPYI